MTRRVSASLFGALALLAASVAVPTPAATHPDEWSRLDGVAQDTIAAGNVPGVIFVVGQKGKIVYRKAFGARTVKPEVSPMTLDTVFDLASLTKVVATTSSVMALIEEGKLRLRDPVVKHWPEFGQNGKEKITVRQLLTHTSGLPSWDNYQKRFGDMQGAPVQDHHAKVLVALAETKLANPIDTKFVYSDLGFITLGELVRRVSGKPLDQYARERIFEPLRMRDTAFNPDAERCRRAAPATLWNDRFLQGQVHDPNAAVLGGVAGHAGLFSTADDLARFAPMLLSSDRPSRRRYPLSPATVRQMTTPHTPQGLPIRGLGWDIDTPYSHVRGDLMPLGSFGHTGFTGTFIWVDPYSESFLIGLSNRLHPDGKGSPLAMWARASNVVSGIVRAHTLPPRPAVVRVNTVN
ncbi:MAG: serine hydrolase domain-containing protein [Actinomycetota bacterium]